MAASVSPSLPAVLQFFNNAGQPNVGGSILTQIGGVNAATYQDSGGTTALPNPIPLNSRGEISDAGGVSRQLFLVKGSVYVFTLYDAAGNQINQFPYMVSGSTSADITTLTNNLATSITTASLTVTGGTTLSTLTVGAITGSGPINIGSQSLTCGAITATGETLSGNLAMGGNAITGASNITATGTVTAGNFVSTGGTINAASFLNGSDVSSGNVFTFDTNGTASGSGITNSAGTITLANAGTYDVLFSAALHQPSGAINIDTGLYFGGTANAIVGPVTGNTQRVLIAGANGAVYGLVSMRAVVVTNAVNQTLTVNSTLAFSGTYVAKARCYITVAQR